MKQRIVFARRAIALRLLIAMLDCSNYQETQLEEGNVRFDFVSPPRLSEESAEVSQRADESMSLMSFPLTCRQLLEGEKVLEEIECPVFWETARKIADQISDDVEDQRRKAAAATGAIAVLMHLHPNWLEADSTRVEWCINQLQLVDSDPPP